MAKVRVDYANAETQRVQFGDELEALKNTVERTNTDLEKLRSNIRYVFASVLMGVWVRSSIGWSVIDMFFSGNN